VGEGEGMPRFRRAVEQDVGRLAHLGPFTCQQNFNPARTA
jgi:hypothetical protein